MLGGLQTHGRQAVDGPAASAAPNTLFGPDAIIGFDPTQVCSLLLLSALNCCCPAPMVYQQTDSARVIGHGTGWNTTVH